MGSRDQGVEQSLERYNAIPRVLCFITIHDQLGHDVLLLRGAPDKKIWPNRYNGVGGHLEPGEDVFSAARREIMEETGLTVRELRLRGVVNIDIRLNRGVLMFLFTARTEHRETIPGSEGLLEWWPYDKLPAAELVEDLPLILPKVLAMSDSSYPFSARYWYDDHERLQIDFFKE